MWFGTLLLISSDIASAGLVTIRVVDQDTGLPVTARVELLDSAGSSQIAQNAIPVNAGCTMPPLPDWLPKSSKTDIYNPYTDTSQFYVDGEGHFSLEPGQYRVRIFKGPEYIVSGKTFQVGADNVEVVVSMKRWSNPAAGGWYGADDHLHIARTGPDKNKQLAAWMSAEGLHVANLLAMGTVDQFAQAPQYAFGDKGSYSSGETLLLSGQEHPRTHIFGHTITLGAESAVDNRPDYLNYTLTFQQAEERGGVGGFGHWGIGHARDGLAVFAPTGLVRFMEVLQMEFGFYDVWYQLLNLGLHVAPTAGTDFPCGPPTIPGRERFYANVIGELSRKSFVEAIRNGRTFVTNGPQLTFTVNGSPIGSRVELQEATIVTVAGSVQFDPERDRIDRVEIVRNGVVLPELVKQIERGRISFSRSLRVDKGAWFALRVSGEKLGESGKLSTPPSLVRKALEMHTGGAGGPELWEYLDHRSGRLSAAHSGAIYVNVAGRAPDIPGELSGEWLERLSALESRLSDDQIQDEAIWDWLPYSDGVSVEYLQRNREALAQAIAFARRFYRGDAPDASGRR